MSVTLLIHRPPTPPQSADKSLSNRLHTSTAPLQPLNKKAQFSLPHKDYRTTAVASSAAATITTRTKIKEIQVFIIRAINSEKSTVAKQNSREESKHLSLNDLDYWL